MFNALNRFISRLDGDSPPAGKENHGQFGFQVLRNTNLQLPIEPWFDFIIGINGRAIDNPSPHLFAQEVRNCAGAAVRLSLWSAKGQRTRTLHIPVPRDAPTLGLALQWTPVSVVTNIWHVLDVPANSPADLAGLLPYSDYILGSPEGVLHGEGGLGELVEDHIGRPLRLYVYNNEYDVTREVTITPSRDWGGEGALGCMLGYGALHRLPAPLSEPVHAPGETLFDGDYTSAVPAGEGPSYFQPAAAVAPGASPTSFVPAGSPLSAGPPQPSSGADFLVPAQMIQTAPPPSGGPPPSRTKKKGYGHHGAGAANDMMDDYFKEQEKKSRELDNAPSGRGTPVPPPPRAGGAAGGPPKGGPPRASATSSPAPPQSPAEG